MCVYHHALGINAVTYSFVPLRVQDATSVLSSQEVKGADRGFQHVLDGAILEATIGAQFMRAPRPETFEPEVLALLGAIYDEAWASVADGYVQADRATREEARAELADIMLRLAEQQLGSNDLRDRALRIFKGSSMATVPAEMSAILSL
jgi:hypothetical protein